MRVSFEHNFGSDEEPFVVEFEAEVLENGEVNWYTAVHAGSTLPDYLMTVPVEEKIDELILEAAKRDGFRPKRDEASLSAEERNPGLAGRG